MADAGLMCTRRSFRRSSPRSRAAPSMRRPRPSVASGRPAARNGLVTLAGPLHGAPELARGPRDGPVLGILPALGPEPAPDVARDDADLVLGDLEDHARQGVAHAMGILHVGVERVP